MGDGGRGRGEGGCQTLTESGKGRGVVNGSGKCGDGALLSTVRLNARVGSCGTAVSRQETAAGQSGCREGCGQPGQSHRGLGNCSELREAFQYGTEK